MTFASAVLALVLILCETGSATAQVQYDMARRVICGAIAAGEAIGLDYEGDRLIEPYAFGIGRNGIGYLRAWQVEGESVSGNPTGWKMFRVDRMTAIRRSQQRMGLPRPDYRRSDRVIVRMECQR